MLVSRELCWASSMIAIVWASAAAAQSVPASNGAVPPPQADSSVGLSAAGDPAAAGGSNAPEDIVVTGSRVSASGFTAPTPTQIVTADNLEQRGLTSIGDFLAELPVFRGSTTSQTNTQSSTGANFADLRGLGSIRTLTLIDGERHVPTSPTGQVDLNLVPTALIDRVDVVTGGASAAWGSDAITGVVNVILRKHLEGVRGDASYGITEHGDNSEKRVSIAGGLAFDGGRGHIVVGGDYVSTSGIDSFLKRDWGQQLPQLVTYPAGRSADQPSRYFATGVQLNNQAYGGLILGNNADTNPANGADVLRGIQFGPGGVSQPFVYGQAVGSTSVNFTGGNANLNNYSNIFAVVPITRHAVMARIEHDLTDDIQAFFVGSEGRSGTVYTAPSGHDTNIVIRRDNPFLPTQIATIMDANAISSFTLGRYTTDVFQPVISFNSQTVRFVGGLQGKFGHGWSWDTYYEWGQNIFKGRWYDQRITQNFNYAWDATTDAAGNAVCRNLTARAAGCQPLNLFGVGSASAAAKAYITGTEYNQIVNTQSAAALNIKGQPFSTWAGPVAIAFGGEYRREAARDVPDAISQAGGWYYGNPKAFAGHYDVKEGYLEAEVPLARHLPFADSLDLNGAVRYSSYSLSGGQTTWKVGGTYAPIPDIRLRIVRSRDIRAPNNSELYSYSNAMSILSNPFSGLQAGVTVTSAPNQSLQPEKSDTFTVGAVFNPRFASRLNISVDFYDIKVKGAIASIDATSILNNCAAEVRAGAPGFYCSYVNISNYSTTSVLSGVTQQLLNLASIRSRGIDFNVSYRFPFGPGTLTLQTAGTYALDLTTNDGLGKAVAYDATGTYIINRGSVINRAGQVGAFTAGVNSGATDTPRWLVNTSLTYKLERLSGTIEGRYVGGGHYDNTLIGPDEAGYSPLSPISIGDNRVKGRYYVNLSAQYDVLKAGERSLAIYGVVSNLTNIDPPFPQTGVSGLYDRLGRNYKIGVRVRY